MVGDSGIGNHRLPQSYTSIVTGHLVMNTGLEALSLEMIQCSFKEVNILKDASTECYFVYAISLPNQTADSGDHFGYSIVEFGRNNGNGNASS